MTWRLPRASGPLPVGCLDIVTKTGIDGTLCRLYYPTKSFEPSEDVCPLWLESPEYGNGFANLIRLDFSAGIFRWMFGSARVPVLWHGPLLMPQDKPKLPLVLFSHGLGASRTTYSYMAYEIASHGFFVASIEHHDQSGSMSFYLEEDENEKEKHKRVWLPYKRVPVATTEERELRNKQVLQRADEISRLFDSIEKLNSGTLTNLLSGFDLEPFMDKIDLDKCAVIGHSFGGATTITSLSKDDRFKAGITLDVWMYPLDEKIYQARIEKPLLFINSEAFQWPSNIAGIRKLDHDVTGVTAERKLATLKGTVHHTQCDFAFLLGSAWLAKLIKMRGPTDPKLANDVNMKLILSFLGKYLDLPCASEVESVIDENPNFAFLGSNVEIDEERLAESKNKLREGLSTKE